MDDLVAAYVEHADQDFRQTVAAAVAGAGPGPRDQILAIFDAVYTQILEGLLATGQALGPDGPARQAPHLAEAILPTARPRPNTP